METKIVTIDLPEYDCNYQLPVTVADNVVLWSAITGTKVSLILKINECQCQYSAKFNLLRGTDPIEKWINRLLSNEFSFTVKVEFGPILRDQLTALTTGLLGKYYKNRKYLDMNDIRNFDRVRDELYDKVDNFRYTLHRISDQLPKLIKC